jgi:signal transduction histidine kinase
VRLPDDVLHLSKLEANKIELNKIIYNPMDVINSAASMFMSQIQEKKITLSVSEPIELPASLSDEVCICSMLALPPTHSVADTSFAHVVHQKPVLVVRGDPDRFMQVVVNLVSNAIKFTHKGSITVSAAFLHRADRTATELRVRARVARIIRTCTSLTHWLAMGTWVTEQQIEVADTGIGMSKEEQSRIFDRFSQASHKTYREYGGSGLGLSIAKGLVALMGGALGVRSSKGAGSTFHFNIECGYVTPFQLEEVSCSLSLSLCSPSAPAEAKTEC